MKMKRKSRLRRNGEISRSTARDSNSARGGSAEVRVLRHDDAVAPLLLGAREGGLDRVQDPVRGVFRARGMDRHTAADGDVFLLRTRVMDLLFAHSMRDRGGVLDDVIGLGA